MTVVAQTSVNPEHSTDDILTMERTSAVAILSLNRPKARNSLSEALLLRLQDAFTDISSNPEIYAVILRAEGSVYSAGHDLKELIAHRNDPDDGRAYFEKILTLCSSVMQQIMSCPKPVIAAVQGTATAAGCQLVATCDLAVAVEEAKFCTPGVNIGLFCSTPMVALSRNVPRKRAMEMLLLGNMISATDAADYGLVNRVVAPEALMPTAKELADTIAKKAPKVLAIGKKAFYDQAELAVPDAYDYATKVMLENMMLRDCEEGVSAFIEKRHAEWGKALRINKLTVAYNATLS